jgi:hypothetical protein
VVVVVVVAVVVVLVVVVAAAVVVVVVVASHVRWRASKPRCASWSRSATPWRPTSRP